MTVTAPDAVLSDTSDWVHSTFMVTMGDDFTSFDQALKEALKDEQYGGVGNPQLEAAASTVLNGVATTKLDDNAMSPFFYSRRKCRDTSLGGNDAINPYYQYCENDDIMHPFHMTNINNAIGMGRVYSETIDDLQRILYLGFGTPKFNNLAGFYKRAYDADLGKMMNSGPDGMSISQTIGELTGYAARAIISVPAIPLTILRVIAKGTEATPISKYYDFKTQMPLYYRMVNSILIQLGVNLGQIDNKKAVAETGRGTNGSNIKSQTYGETQSQISSELGDDAGSPDYIREYNFDMFRVMLKRAMYEKDGTDPSKFSTDYALDKQAAQGATINTTTSSAAGAASAAAETGLISSIKNSLSSAFGGSSAASPADAANNQSVLDAAGTFARSELNAFAAAYSSSFHDAFLFIGFRVERGTTSSESLSTSTTQSPVQQQINSHLQAARNVNFAAMGGNLGSGMIASALQEIGGAVTGLAEGFAEGFGVSGLAALATGGAMFDIPEVWQDSNFTKSYSFNFQLKAPYGDPVTIMQSLYVPLACLLAGALPRATGASSYASPFLCQAYCKGMFSVPLGIIDQLSVNRGSDTHGWNMMGLPLCIDISMSIKDLSPSMYVALSGSSLLSAISDVWNVNSPFNQYLLTLSGAGPLEWVSPYENFARRMKVLRRVIPENMLNPIYLGMMVQQKSPLHYIANFWPKSEYTPR